MTGWTSKKSAFTLMELLVSVLIFAVIMILVSGVLTRVVSSARTNSEDQEIQQTLFYAAEYIQEKLSGAQINFPGQYNEEKMCNYINSLDWTSAGDSSGGVYFKDRFNICHYFGTDVGNQRLLSCTSLLGDWSDQECFYLTPEGMNFSSFYFSNDSNVEGVYALSIVSSEGNTYSLQRSISFDYFQNYEALIEEK